MELIDVWSKASSYGMSEQLQRLRVGEFDDMKLLAAACRASVQGLLAELEGQSAPNQLNTATLSIQDVTLLIEAVEAVKAKVAVEYAEDVMTVQPGSSQQLSVKRLRRLQTTIRTVVLLLAAAMRSITGEERQNAHAGRRFAQFLLSCNPANAQIGEWVAAFLGMEEKHGK